MKVKNTILLLIKQNPGITQEELLNKISSNYGNINSARAALSRALKDFLAVGFITKKDKRYYITEKGNLEIGKEMKNKLILQINYLVGGKNKELKLKEIVEKLQIFIERGKADKDLFISGRNAATFTLKDLKVLEGEIEERIEKLKKLNELLKKQIKMLEEMDFKDKTHLKNPKTILNFIKRNYPENSIYIKQKTAENYEKIRGVDLNKINLDGVSEILFPDGKVLFEKDGIVVLGLHSVIKKIEWENANE